MRTKPAFFLIPLALMLCVCALSMPITAHAASAGDVTPPGITASFDGQTLYIDTEDDLSGVEAVYIDGNRVTTLVNGDAAVPLKDYAGTGTQVRIYALDYAGNRSDTLGLENPYAVPSGGGTAAGGAGNAFTPEGTGAVLDEATETGDDKQFYTITSAAGNVFYLVIDGQREDNNVYFLNTVTEDDLTALAEQSGGTQSAVPEVEACSCSIKCEFGAVNTACPVCKNNLTACTGKAPEPEEPQDEPEEEGDSTGLLVFLLLTLLIAGGAGYYFKILRPKQQAALDDEDGDFEDDSYGEGFDPDAEYGTMEYLPDEETDETSGDGQ